MGTPPLRGLLVLSIFRDIFAFALAYRASAIFACSQDHRFLSSSTSASTVEAKALSFPLSHLMTSPCSLPLIPLHRSILINLFFLVCLMDSIPVFLPVLFLLICISKKPFLPSPCLFTSKRPLPLHTFNHATYSFIDNYHWNVRIWLAFTHSLRHFSCSYICVVSSQEVNFTQCICALLYTQTASSMRGMRV